MIKIQLARTRPRCICVSRPLAPARPLHLPVTSLIMITLLTPSRTRCPENGTISIQFHTPCIQYMFPELPFQFVKRIRSFISLNSKAIYFVFYRSLKFSLQSTPQINIEHIVFDDKTQVFVDCEKTFVQNIRANN